MLHKEGYFAAQYFFFVYVIRQLVEKERKKKLETDLQRYEILIYSLALMVQKIQNEREYLPPRKRKEIFDFREEYEEIVEDPWIKRVKAKDLTMNSIKKSKDRTTAMYGTIESQQSKAVVTSKGTYTLLHSILRIHRTKESPSHQTKNLKKNASVEFALDVLEEPLKIQRIESQQKEVPTSSPRRLTEEEKEELYRLRPDLRMSPIPFLFKRIEGLRQKKKRRMILCVGCGFVIMFALLFIYHISTGL
jgi:hypothetical protein